MSLRHFFKQFTTVVVLICISLSLDAAPMVLKGAVKRYGNVLTTQVFSIKKGESQISVEYPINGNKVIVKTIRRLIAELVAGNNINYYSSLNNPDELLRTTIKKYQSEGEMGMDGETIEKKISVSYSNGKVITIRSTGYLYMGGAHGTPWDESYTFLVKDGTKLTKSMLPSFKTLRPYLLSGLAKYFGVSVSELFNDGYIYVTDLDFPTSNPYIDKNGLNFIYSAYEIAPFSAGMPKATIPIATARRLCKGTALRFF